MKCLRSGYCCIHYDVIIVDKPELGIVPENLIHKPNGIKCQHLKGEQFRYECTIHNYDWYQETPCFAYTQIESSNTFCRTGEYLKNKKE